MLKIQAEKVLYKEKYIRQEINKCDKMSLVYMLKDARGRYFLAKLFDRCRINKRNYSIFKNKMLINEGKRKIALNTYNSIQNLVNEDKKLQQYFQLIELEADTGGKNIRQYIKFRLGEKEKMKAAIDYIFADKYGRWYLARLFEFCHINAMPIADIEKTNTFYKAEGERQVAVDIGNLIKKMGREYIIKKQLALQEYEDYKSRLQHLAVLESERYFDEKLY